MMKKYLILLAFFAGFALSATAYQPIIQEGKVWEYLEDVTHRGAYDVELRYTRYCFKGTEEKYGKEYAIWTLIEETICKLSEDSEDDFYETESTTLNNPVALLRENDGVLYMLLQSPKINIYDPDSKAILPYITSEGEEAILYDFNLEQGDWFEMLYDSYCLTNAFILKTKEALVGGKEVKAYYMATGVESPDKSPDDGYRTGLKCIESVGIVTDGTLTSIVSREFAPYPTCSEWLSQGLYALYDEQGEILYRNLNISKPAGITNLNSTSVKTHPMYDLFGREITRPLPGSIYIRNGKKLIGK